MKVLFLLGCSLAVASPAWAQDTGDDVTVADPIRNTMITVTATGEDQRIDWSGQPISVVGTEELESIQGPDLTRALERLPGVEFSRTGGIGAQTGLFVRGGNSDEVLVLIDGVRIADYASPGGAYDLGNLLAGDLEKVELLRGSNSVIWGSQAIAGVLAVTTREVNGAEASAEYGAYNTFDANGTAGISRDRYAASLSAGYVHSDGFSAESGGSEPDRFRQWRVSGKGRIALGDAFTLRALGRYADGRVDIDQFGPDSPDVQYTREATARGALDYAHGGLTASATYDFGKVDRSYATAFGPSQYKGHSHRIGLTGRAELPAHFALDFGADNEWTAAQSTYDPKATAQLSSAHALLGWYTPAVSLAAGVRVDHHDRFGTHWTVGANGTVALVDGWRLRASYGEGFKAPTLYQLFGGFVGNTALRPEQSRSYDVGIEKGDRNAPLHIAATWFRRDTRNLIDLDANFVYQNVASARAEGLEVELGAKLGERLHAMAAYTYLKARDLTFDRDLARRPRHTVTLSADWQTPVERLTLGGDLRFASKAVEYPYGGGVNTLASYAVATLRADLAVTDEIELFGRIENVGNTDYQTAYGYNTPGRSAYIGARARF